jgi:hypothetical protein
MVHITGQVNLTLGKIINMSMIRKISYLMIDSKTYNVINTVRY